MKNLAKEARERLGAVAANLQRPKRQAKKIHVRTVMVNAN